MPPVQIVVPRAQGAPIVIKADGLAAAVGQANATDDVRLVHLFVFGPLLALGLAALTRRTTRAPESTSGAATTAAASAETATRAAEAAPVRTTLAATTTATALSAATATATAGRGPGHGVAGSGSSSSAGSIATSSHHRAGCAGANG